MVAGVCGRDRAGRGRGAPRARPRLPRRPAQPRRAEGRERRRAASSIARPSPREIPLVGFYLQPAVGGLDSARRSGAASPRSRTWWRSRSRRSTATARSTSCAASSRRGAEDRIALYTGNDDHIVLDLVDAVRAMRDGRPVTRALPRRPARPLVGLDAQAPSSCSSAARRGRGARAAARSMPTCSRSTAASPTATAPSSTSRTTSTAASPAATRCCAARACSKAPGASIPDEGLSPGQREEIDRVCASTPICPTTPSSPRTSSAGWPDRLEPHAARQSRRPQNPLMAAAPASLPRSRCSASRRSSSRSSCACRFASASSPHRGRAGDRPCAACGSTTAARPSATPPRCSLPSGSTRTPR